MVRACLSGWCARGAGERRAAAHPVELPGPLHVLEVLPADVVLDERALLAHHRGLALLLLRHRLGLRAPRAQALQLLLLQPLAGAQLLLLDVLSYHLLAQVVLLVARLQLDDLVRSPPRLLDLLESLAFLLPEPLQAVPQQLHVML